MFNTLTRGAYQVGPLKVQISQLALNRLKTKNNHMYSNDNHNKTTGKAYQQGQQHPHDGTPYQRVK